MLDNFGIDEGLMTTIHAMTATQPTVDGPSKKDFRGGRGAGQNAIPARPARPRPSASASRGQGQADGHGVPHSDGRRVGRGPDRPHAKDTSLAEINAAMKKASETTMKGFLGYTEEPVVSSDFIGCPLSSIYDATACIELNSKFFKLISWYDNEMGYSCRVIDLIKFMAKKDGLL